MTANPSSPAPTRDSIRVCLVGRGQPEQGGIPVMLDQLAHFDHPGVELTLLNLAPGTQGDGGASRGGGGGGRFDRSGLARTAADIGRVLVRARHHDIIHLHSALAPTSTMVRAGALAAAGRAGGSRVVIHAHGGFLPHWMTTRHRSRLTRTCLGLAHQVVAVARPVRDSLAAVVDPDRLSLVANGVDTDRFRPAPESTPGPAPRILFVGHLSEQKGVVDLLDASDQLLAAGIEHRLVLAGANRLSPDQTARLRADHVHWLGPVAPARMPATYQGADVFCLPSHWEAMPLAVLEAMASGLPVVASRVGQVPDMVDHGTTGLVTDPHRPDLLAADLAQLIRQPVQRLRMGQAGRALARARFSEDAMRAATVDIYRKTAP